MSKIEKMLEKLYPYGVEYKSLDEIFNIRNGYTPSKNNKEYWKIVEYLGLDWKI